MSDHDTTTTARPRSRPRADHERRRAGGGCACAGARGAARREGRHRSGERCASGSTGSSRVRPPTGHGSSLAHGWIPSSSGTCSPMRAQRRSTSVSIREKRRSSSRSRTPTGCTTWSSARSAPATRRALLGPPPDWYKSMPYRSRAVSDPRGVLVEFGVELGDDVELRVVDSTADIRYLVIPRRPAGSETMSEEQLSALVTRDSMIGVAVPAAPLPQASASETQNGRRRAGFRRRPLSCQCDRTLQLIRDVSKHKH